MNLEELKALCENATPGPWEVVKDNEFYSCTVYPDKGAPIASEMLLVNGESDARFIATARTALPKLTAAVEEILSLPRPSSGDDDESQFIAKGKFLMLGTITGIINNALEES